MVWTIEKAAFEVQLNKIGMDAFLHGKAKLPQAQQFRDTLKKARQFLTNLEELNDFCSNNENIEDVLVAATSYLADLNKLKIVKATDNENKLELVFCKMKLESSYQNLFVKNEQLVKNIDMLRSENTKPINYNRRLSTVSIVVGITFIVTGIFTLAAGPVGLAAVGIAALLLGALLAIYSAQSLHQTRKFAFGAQLKEITDFVSYLNPVLPTARQKLDTQEITRDQTPVEPLDFHPFTMTV